MLGRARWEEHYLKNFCHSILLGEITLILALLYKNVNLLDGPNTSEWVFWTLKHTFHWCTSQFLMHIWHLLQSDTNQEVLHWEQAWQVSGSQDALYPSVPEPLPALRFPGQQRLFVLAPLLEWSDPRPMQFSYNPMPSWTSGQLCKWLTWPWQTQMIPTRYEKRGLTLTLCRHCW